MTQFNKASTLPLSDDEKACHCPFLGAAHQICQAALRPMWPGRAQITSRCCRDDHDDCVYFLSRALRSGRAQGGVRDARSESEK